MKYKLAAKVELNDVIKLKNGFGHTSLNPCGNLVVDKELKVDENRDRYVLLTISGWDGDFLVRFDCTDVVSVEA